MSTIALTSAAETHPLLPPPLDAVLLLHLVTGLVVLSASATLGSLGKLRLSPGSWLGVLVLTLGPLLVAGPVAAAALVVRRMTQRSAKQNASVA